ncbi:tetratricopeptide repeat-containing sensor histidine kinase [Seonamhaeicola marinus]|uniref:histidine kinase n=1 Tax=Seonamhaeicola marinus TaxID=1912246 RepID=A0A5D0HF93_9FLAO|nr:sensor histidine kinase [Seonamhaeicola marinus]TYA69966.1 tetratricopeptide repeat protein [Seonamhaeicola marinus]
MIDSIKKSVKNLKPVDSVNIANQHYKIGEFYRYSQKSDSAFYYYNKAEKVFKKQGLKYELAITYYGIAVVQCNEKDYTGSEVTSVEAIALLETLGSRNDVRKYKSFLYNNLGIVYDELEQFDVAIQYYEKSLRLKRGLKGDFTRSIGLTLNNMLKAYRRAGNYELAIEKYREILSNSDLTTNYPEVFVLALGNYANTLYVSKEHDKLPGLYIRALEICDSINDNYNSIIIHQHLAEYYNYINVKDSAKYYAYRAKDLSTEYYNDDLLKSLKLLSEIEEGDTATDYLKQYVELNDSIQNEERKIRNKFARIRFETDQIEKENIKIAKERMWLLIISTVLIIASFLLYLVIRQRIKNKELQFVQQQQEANEEIYNLMLSQNDSIEEARTLEKRRISEELHDGVLGRLFGTRLSLDSLNMANSADAVKTRGDYIEELKSIEEDIRKVSHELNTDFVAGGGFRDIIETLIETQSSAYKFQFEFTHDDSINWDIIPNKNKIHIYRIIQETLNNIYKHANASLVNISFKLKKNVICLVMKDNGAGFQVNRARSGIGLKNMKSRIKEIKGELNITSKVGVGTKVRIEVPVTETTTNV